MSTRIAKLYRFFNIFTIRPPSGGFSHSTSSMNERINKIPRPLAFNRFSGFVGSGIFSTEKPVPKSRTVISKPAGLSANVSLTGLVSSNLFPCFYGIGNRLADRKINCRRNVVAKAAAFSKFIGHHRGFVNRFDTARQLYFTFSAHNICFVSYRFRAVAVKTNRKYSV